MAQPVFGSPEQVLGHVGQELGVSEWLMLTQAQIDEFAHATGDDQWIHVDPVRASHGPFGACIAHGYLTLSLIGHFLPRIATLENLKMGVNYGCGKVRFPAVARVGARLRGRGRMLSAERTKDGGVQAVIEVIVEVEGQERPACVAETISRYYF
ncbi:MAG: MaoC family dehydratase [Nevskiaceae bacterium]|nr:MAG: MaoC family dehydratase [Nevskiaceae bacterium]TBR71377.1 MAG: MaoC family dehydratase [Nevskiaceae bacterium]